MRNSREHLVSKNNAVITYEQKVLEVRNSLKRKNGISYEYLECSSFVLSLLVALVSTCFRKLHNNADTVVRSYRLAL